MSNGPKFYIGDMPSTRAPIGTTYMTGDSDLKKIAMPDVWEDRLQVMHRMGRKGPLRWYWSAWITVEGERWTKRGRVFTGRGAYRKANKLRSSDFFQD